MGDRLRFYLGKLNERLWVRPLVMCVLSVALAFAARVADGTGIARAVPDISPESVESLLSIISSSMLVIATLAVTSMVSAYASASNTATPRSFSLVVADDVSQNALSTFIGIFIFSIVALIALKMGYYDRAGRFVLFVLTMLAFALVIGTFVRWVDRIARLGRLGSTVDAVEAAADRALRRRRAAPTMCGVRGDRIAAEGEAVCADRIGYVQRVDMAALQGCAEARNFRVAVVSLPGTFAAPGRELARISGLHGPLQDADRAAIDAAFVIGKVRTFEDDPRFGLIVLSEIASRALSPATNDPGTAIDIVGRFVRLLTAWGKPLATYEQRDLEYDRVAVPELSTHDLFDDAFTAIARDGAATVEVAVRLQKALAALATTCDAVMCEAAKEHARMALARADSAMPMVVDREAVRRAAQFAEA